ncbi:MAG: hypothetical protein JSV43_00270 [Methanobacteriota archaeon]|nr:MAG: hypothetical protein JSV43_00270 [Euryarchaeota archaeon]
MEPDSYETLRRKERWYGRLMVIFFVAGITLSFISYAYWIMSLEVAFEGTGETAPETLIELEKKAEVFRIGYALGSSLVIVAFILLIYWAYLMGQRKGMEEPGEKQKEKRTWKVLQPRKLH